jgi:hypothetical protein
MRRFLFIVAVTGVGLGIACSSADFTPATPKDCNKVECTCEEDPTQPTCKAIPSVEGGLEGGNVVDGPVLDAPVSDGAEDAASDASGDADAGDQ